MSEQKSDAVIGSMELLLFISFSPGLAENFVLDFHHIFERCIVLVGNVAIEDRFFDGCLYLTNQWAGE